MKKITIFIFMFLIIFTSGCNNKNATVTEAIAKIGFEEKDNSRKYDLDERFKYFQWFTANGEGCLRLNNEEGITSLIFYTKENEDGSVECTLKEVCVVNYGDHGMGYLSTEELIKSVVGDDIVFTLVLEDNVVTTHDLPTLLPLN